MDELITKHAAIMDKTRSRRRGSAWSSTSGAPGTTWSPARKPGFLYQQNTLRDALVAALNFHIFHQHADRVTMANIAQTVNVLQAMILTDKEKMLLTPTYHVFEMFKVHQGGTFLPVELQSPDYAFGSEKIPMVSASATRGAKDSTVSLSLVNTHPAQAVTMAVKVAGFAPKSVTGRVLTAPVMDVGLVVDSKRRTVAQQALALAGTACCLKARPPTHWCYSDYLRCGPVWYLRNLRVMMEYPTEQRIAEVAAPRSGTPRRQRPRGLRELVPPGWPSAPLGG